MNRNDGGDVPDQLKHLRKLTAPASFEGRLRHRIRLLPSRNGYRGWFLRPVPVALAVGVGALVIAFFALPYYFSESSSLPGEGLVPVPTGQQPGQLPGQNPSENMRIAVPLPADSLSTDSSSVRRNDVNTSKMP